MDLKTVLFCIYFFQEEIESGQSGEGSGEGSGKFDVSTINLALIFNNGKFEDWNLSFEII